MTLYTSKSDIKVLMVKIEKMQERIKNQSEVSPLDIDLQLDYIRNLYDAYLELKYSFAGGACNFVGKSLEDNDNSEISDCGTLSLFGGAAENVSELKNDVPINNLIEKEAEMEEEPQTEQPHSEPFIEEEIFTETEFPEEEEELEEVEEEAEMEDEEEFEEVEEMEEEAEEEDFPVVEMEVEMDLPVYSKLLVNQEKESRDEEAKTVADINLDDIEFDDDDEEMEVVKKNPVEMPHSRYYGDEIEIENPIPVKPATIGDRYKTEKPTLNEIVSSYKPDACIATKMQQSGISDLMKSMDMNHKFMFVKELFKGNGSIFTEEICKLNNFNKLNEAIPYLESIKAKYKWDGQSEAYTELYRLVLRKFAK